MVLAIGTAVVEQRIDDPLSFPCRLSIPSVPIDADT